jgi:hypothetical protein
MSRAEVLERIALGIGARLAALELSDRGALGPLLDDDVVGDPERASELDAGLTRHEASVAARDGLVQNHAAAVRLVGVGLAARDDVGLGRPGALEADAVGGDRHVLADRE